MGTSSLNDPEIASVTRDSGLNFRAQATGPSGEVEQRGTLDFTTPLRAPDGVPALNDMAANFGLPGARWG